MTNKSKTFTEQVAKCIYILLLIVAFSSFSLGFLGGSFGDSKVRETIFYSSTALLWFFIGIIPREMLSMARLTLKMGHQREIAEYEIWLYRVLSILWIYLSAKNIRDIWIYR